MKLSRAQIERDKRNLNPHRAARAAMWLFGARYAAQDRGSMDFWDSLSDSDKRSCRELVGHILNSPAEPR